VSSFDGVVIPVTTPFSGDDVAPARREIATRMMVADRGIAGRHGIGGLQVALELPGFYGGSCRSPLGTPDGDAIDDIEEVLATAGLL
jgi:hypothetical protein